MRIAIDARMAGKPLSGAGRYAINLIRALAELDHENQYFILQNIHFAEPITEAKNFRTLWVKYPPLSLRTIFWLQSLLKKKRVDLFHSLYFLAPLGGRFANIITVHDLMALTFPNFFQGRSLPVRAYAKLFSHVFIRSSVICSDQIITDSETVRAEVSRWKPRFERKITVICPAVDSSLRKINDPKPIERIKSKFGLTKKTILYVGNTRPYKNLPRLIKAFKLLTDNSSQSCQLVIGGGESRNLPLLKGLTKTLELQDSVVFTGNLTDEEVIALMNAADIFVFPSLYEGFGLPPLEAMACGTPVVTSNAGSLPEVVGDAALLVNPESEEEIYSAMKRLLSDKELRKNLIKKGFERVKLFSWEKAAGETLQIYKAMMNEKQLKVTF
jgi:glycosyltransferase involved in cell wall biosynthesis